MTYKEFVETFKSLTMLSANKQQLALYGVNRIGLFGSYVRNEMTPNSDIDLLVDIQMEILK